MNDNQGVSDNGIKKSHITVSKTVYGKFIFLDKIYVNTLIVKRKNSDKVALKKVTSIIQY
jgi:hypothetical protein